MARSDKDISNTAVRILLARLGRLYDKERLGREYKGSRTDKIELLDFFGWKCCYCNKPIGKKVEEKKKRRVVTITDEFDQDHLVSCNRECLGLHSWGNMVPSCKECNAEKLNKDWKEFLLSNSETLSERVKLYNADDVIKRIKKIESYIQSYKYEPDTSTMEGIVKSLYDEAGELINKLINQKEKEYLAAQRVKINASDRELQDL